ncbi:MAG: bicyclomycin resistance protein [Rubrivivax sp.]|nr:bicyclomycin resistance protein [Rubrivivax sp.]
MKRRHALALPGALALPAAAAAPPPKVLRVAFQVAETGFDPARVSDIYSAAVNCHIFEGLLQYDYLARPVKLRPRLAMALPEASDDHRVWTVRLRPGVFFADDPAFKGARRELVAADVVYSFKRFADPAVKSPNWQAVADLGFVGLAELRRQAVEARAPFAYDAEIEGLRALDRHTVRFTLARPLPRFAERLAIGQTFGIVAREVIEAWGERSMEHPVGTGPFRLASWRRSSQIVLERNPTYRDERWDAEPAADDAEGQAILRRLKGQRLPLVDRVEISVIEEAQPRWLSFLNAQVDLVAVPPEFGTQAVPGGRLAPNLARRGVQAWRNLATGTQFAFFNMEHPLVGGYTAEKVALRRAIFLGYDVQREIDHVYHGGAVLAQSLISPHGSGFDPAFRSDAASHSPARAKALLDLYGYVDRDGDGWREQPDGQPLVIEMATQADSQSRKLDELWKKAFDGIGIRVVFKPAKWPENLKAARAGRLMFWRLGTTATIPDGQQTLQRLYGPESGLGNIARFRLEAFDEVFERLTSLPDGPGREALFNQAKRLAVAYAPYRAHVHQYVDTLAQPWIVGFRRPVFGYDWWHCVDVLPHSDA